MIQGLRAEFPEAVRFAERLRRPAIAREAPLWAVVSALGAGLVAHSLGLVTAMPVFDALFPLTREHPAWLTPAAVANVLSAFAAGLVLLRAGGLAGSLAYVAYQTLAYATALPVQLRACERFRAFAPTGGIFGLPDPCDLLGALVARWPWALALVLGIAASRWLVRLSPAPANRTLRGAGAFALVTAVVAMVLGLALGGAGPEDPAVGATLALGGYVVAAAVAGVVLVRAPFAGALLVALLIAAPAAAVNLPMVRAQAALPQPTELLVPALATLLAPPLAAVLLLAVRAYARRHVAAG